MHANLLYGIPLWNANTSACRSELETSCRALMPSASEANPARTTEKPPTSSLPISWDVPTALKIMEQGGDITFILGLSLFFGVLTQLVREIKK